MIACFNCGVCETTLVEIRKCSSHRKPLYLCAGCHDEYRVGYIALVECESCGIDFITDSDESPYMCKTCLAFACSYKIPQELTYEDFETSGYLPKTEQLKSTAMCLKKAIRIYVENRQNEDKAILRDRAVTFFKISKGLPDNSLVIGEMSRICKQHDIKPMDYFKLMANYDRAEEGLIELLSISKEEGYHTYQAAFLDKQESKLGTEPYHVMEYTVKHPPSLCLEKDDPYSDLPF